MEKIGVALFIIFLLFIVGLVLWGVMVSNEEQAAAQRKREEAEEARLEPKRRELRVLRAKAEGERAFLNPEYRERYGYEHYDEVRGEKWEKELALYDQWEADADFAAIAHHELEATNMIGVWGAKRRLVQFVGGLTEADRKSWEQKQFGLFAEADRRGLTIEELRVAKAKERLAAAEKELTAAIQLLRDVLPKRILECVQRSFEVALREERENSNEARTLEENVKTRLPEAVFTGIDSPNVDVARQALVLFQRKLLVAVAEDRIEEVVIIRSRERRLLDVLKPWFESDGSLAATCEEVEHVVLGLVHECIENSRQLWDAEQWKVAEPHWTAWAEDYRQRWWKERRKEDFLTLMGSKKEKK